MVQAIKQKNHVDIHADKYKLKLTLDHVLDTLGLPPCDDIQKARKVIRDAVDSDRTFQKHIDEVIKLATNIVYDKREKKEEEDQSWNANIYSESRPISFVILNPAF